MVLHQAASGNLKGMSQLIDGLQRDALACFDVFQRLHRQFRFCHQMCPCPAALQAGLAQRFLIDSIAPGTPPSSHGTPRRTGVCIHRAWIL